MIYYTAKTAEKQENIADLKFDISSFIDRDLLLLYACASHILSTIRIFKNLWNIVVSASNVLFQENVISETTAKLKFNQLSLFNILYVHMCERYEAYDVTNTCTHVQSGILNSRRTCSILCLTK